MKQEKIKKRTFVKTQDLLYESCDVILEEAKRFYFQYETFLTPSDKKVILDILLRIERCGKRVPSTEKQEMYKKLLMLRSHYQK